MQVCFANFLSTWISFKAKPYFVGLFWVVEFYIEFLLGAVTGVIPYLLSKSLSLRREVFRFMAGYHFPNRSIAAANHHFWLVSLVEVIFSLTSRWISNRKKSGTQDVVKFTTIQAKSARITAIVVWRAGISAKTAHNCLNCCSEYKITPRRRLL
jgi:hypothetical protein